MSSDDLHREREQKIQEFQEHIEKRLNVELENLLQIRERQYFELSAFLELRNNIEMLKQNNLKKITTMRSESLLFSSYSPDATRIYVNVGLGFHVEFTLDEALKFIEVKEKYLNNSIEELTKKINRVRAQINYLYQGIETLKQL